MSAVTLTPLAEATNEEMAEIRTSVWCWSLAHYEEYLRNLRWFLHNVPEHHSGLHAVHRHHHGDPCTGECKLVSAETNA